MIPYMCFRLITLLSLLSMMMMMMEPVNSFSWSNNNNHRFRQTSIQSAHHYDKKTKTTNHCTQWDPSSFPYRCRYQYQYFPSAQHRIMVRLESSSKNLEHISSSSSSSSSPPVVSIESSTTTTATTMTDFSILKEQIQSLIESRYGPPPTTLLSLTSSSSAAATTTTATSLSSASASTNEAGVGKINHNKNRLRQYLYHSKERNTPMDIEDIIEVMDFLDKVFYNEKNKKELVQNIFYSSPRILRRNVECQLKPAVAFLKSLYGHDIFVQAVSRNPDLLIVSGVGFKSKDNGEAVTSFFCSELGMTPTSIDKVKRIAPTVFQLSVQDTIQPVIQFLASIVMEEDFTTTTTSTGTNNKFTTLDSKTKKVIARVVANNPSLLHLNLDTNLRPKIAFLKDVGYMDNTGLSNLIRSCPGVLGLSIEDNLRPTVNFLMNEIGLCSHDPTTNTNTKTKKQKKSNTKTKTNRKTKRKTAKTENMKLDQIDNMKEHDEENDDEVCDIEAAMANLKRCLCRHPQILGLSLENLKCKVDYFDAIDALSISSSSSKSALASTSSSSPSDEKSTISSSQSLATRIAISAPSTFSLSLKDNIIPKVECLANMWGVSYPNTDDDIDHNVSFQGDGTTLTSLAKFLSEYPTVLTLSLEGNIQPTIQFYNRTGYIRLNGLGELITQGPSLKKQQTDHEDNMTYNHLENTDVLMNAVVATPGTTAATAATTTTDNYEIAISSESSSKGGGILRARHLATSLFNRLLPRWHYLIDEMTIYDSHNNNNHDDVDIDDDKDARTTTDSKKGKNKQPKLSPSSGIVRPPIHILASATDDQFTKYYNIDISDYEKYKKDAIPRLKFSTQFVTWIKTGRPIDDT